MAAQASRPTITAAHHGRVFLDRGAPCCWATPMTLAEEVEAVTRWWHSIDLGDGIVTPGAKSVADLEYEWHLMQLGDMAGKTVLDIGAWDGWMSFAGERAGAARVVALDHYVWVMDIEQEWRYEQECADAGVRPLDAELVPSVWRPDELPGKRGFDLAKAALSSHVDEVVDDFMTMDLEALGAYDVVIYLGVLYHMRHPMLALERVRQVTRGVAYIETQAIVVPDRPDWPICEFYETDDLAGDRTNWWAPTMPALIGMCRAAGFSTVEALSPVPEAHDEIIRYAAMVKAS
jgi:tRNA (mo5U34)-methyltransferase